MKTIANVTTTLASEEDAHKLSQILIETKLVACCHICPIKSIYEWEWEIQEEDEYLLSMKGTVENEDKIRSKIEELHPYDVPMIISSHVGANQDYYQWICSQLK